MSNLDSARQAIQTELHQVRLGAEHYSKRVAALEAMLQSLSALEGGAIVGEAPKKRGRKPGSKVAPSLKGKRGRPAKASNADVKIVKAPKAKAAGTKDLPSTKGTFWQDQVGTEPKSWSEILDGAVAALRISPSAEQRKKLQQRMIFSINALAKSGAIKDSGSGRDRRFFK